MQEWFGALREVLTRRGAWGALLDVLGQYAGSSARLADEVAPHLHEGLRGWGVRPPFHTWWEDELLERWVGGYDAPWTPLGARWVLARALDLQDEWWVLVERATGQWFQQEWVTVITESGEESWCLRRATDALPLTPPAGLWSEHALAGVRAFSWVGAEVSLETMRGLAGAVWSPGVRRLTFNTTAGWSEAHAEALCGMDAPRLATLTLAFSDLRDEHLAALAGWPALARLDALSLAEPHLTAAGLRAILDSPHAPALTSLDLAGSPLGDEALVLLCEHPATKALLSLNLAGTRVTTESLRFLEQSALVRRLHHLDLSFSAATRDGAAYGVLERLRAREDLTPGLRASASRAIRFMDHDAEP